VPGSVDQHAAQHATKGVARQHIVSNMIGCHRSVPSLVLVVAIYGVKSEAGEPTRIIIHPIPAETRGQQPESWRPLYMT
jgi:hypothetical protein